MRKRRAAVLIIAVIYICTAGAGLLLFSNAKYRADDEPSGIDVNVEYLSLRTTGGYTGRVDEQVKVYTEGDKYYLESSMDGGIRHELTKLEYLLCTDIDYQMLYDQKGLDGNDLTYTKVDYRMKGGETASLPQKCYTYFSGMVFFYERIKATPYYNISRADEIAADLGKYCYLHGSPDVRYISNCANRNASYMEFYYGKGGPEEHYEFYEAGKDGISNNAGIIACSDTDSSVPSHGVKDALKDYKKFSSGSETYYYQVQSNDRVTLVSMIDYSDHTYFCTYFDKAQVTEKDILRIMTGNAAYRSGLYISLAAETLVTAAAVIFVLAKPKKKA